MQFKTIGKRENPCILLIHGMLVTGKCFNEIAKLLEQEYFIIIPTLDGHEKSENSTFISAVDEADKILLYLKKKGIYELEVMLGTSLGGVIGFEILKKNDIPIKKTVLDGIQLEKYNKLLQIMFLRYTMKLVKESKLKPDKKNLFDKQMPRLASMIKEVCTYISYESIKNILYSCHNCVIPKKIDINNQKLIFIFGSKEPAKKCIPKLKNICNCEIILKDGYDHCQFLIDEPKEYIKLLI